MVMGLQLIRRCRVLGSTPPAPIHPEREIVMKMLIQQWLHPVLLLSVCTLIVIAFAQQTAEAKSAPHSASAVVAQS